MAVSTASTVVVKVAPYPRSPSRLSLERDLAKRPHHPPVSTPSAPSAPSASPSLTRSIAVCLLYAVCSITITFFNKAIFAVYAFRFPCFLTLLQILVCIFALSIAHVLGFVSLPPLSRRLTRLVCPLALCWWTYVISGISALRYLNIPMFSTLRKATALFVLVMETFLLHNTVKPSIWVSVLIMVAGGFIAGATDLSFSATGYLLVAICCLATALYLVLIVRVGKRSGLDTFQLLYYNNMLALPLMLFYLLVLTDEPSNVVSYPHIRSFTFWAFLLLSAAQATLLNIAIFLCTNLNSPLATTVTGQMKDFVTVGFGLFVFGDVRIHAPNLVGLAVSLFGSFLYSVIKLIAARRRAAGHASSDE